MLQIVFAPLKNETLFSTYTLSINNQVQYVGYCRFVDILRLPDIISHPEFDRAQRYTLQVHFLDENKYKCHNYATEILRALPYKPIYNRVLFKQYNSNVICDQTGEVWESATACARATGIPSSRLSCHLNRRPGHKTIKGLTYSKYLATNAELIAGKAAIPTAQN